MQLRTPQGPSGCISHNCKISQTKRTPRSWVQEQEVNRNRFAAQGWSSTPDGARKIDEKNSETFSNLLRRISSPTSNANKKMPSLISQFYWTRNGLQISFYWHRPKTHIICQNENRLRAVFSNWSRNYARAALCLRTEIGWLVTFISQQRCKLWPEGQHTERVTQMERQFAAGDGRQGKGGRGERTVYLRCSKWRKERKTLGYVYRHRQP